MRSPTLTPERAEAAGLPAPAAPSGPRPVDAAPAGPRELAWAAVVLGLGAVALGLAYAGWLPVVLLVLSATVPFALVVAGSRWLSTRVVALAVLAVVVVLAVVLVRDSAPPGAGAPGLLADAVPRLLTGTRPVPAAADLLALAVLVTGTCGVLVGARLARTRRAVLVAPGCAVVLYAAATALTAGQLDPYGLLAACLVVVSVLGWGLVGDRAVPNAATRAAGTRVDATRAEGTRAAGRTRAADAAGAGGGRVRAVLALALVGVPVLVGASVLDRSTSTDLREVVQPPVRDIVVANPLPLLDRWGRDPEQELFTVSGAAFPLHLAVLSSYDGASWSAPSQFRPLGQGAPTLPPGLSRTQIDAHVTLGAIPQPWLPAGGDPVSLSRSGALVDVDSGTVIDPGASPGTSYDVVGELDAPDDAAAAGGSLPDAVTAATYLSTPGLPQPLRDYARAAVGGAVTPFERAKALEAAVRGSRALDPTAPGGSSFRRISMFLLGPEGTRGAQAGTSEQFATSFAVLARAVGLPTRIVVGFTPGTDVAGDGVRVVRGRDALAWPEVYLTGAGWVPFSPTPDGPRLGPDLHDQAPIPALAPSPSVTPTTAATQVAPPQPAPASPSPAPAGPDRTLLVLGALLAVLLMLPLVVLRLLRARRRSGHQRAGAPGAWAELLDAAHLAGLRQGPGQDARDLAASLDRCVGGGQGARDVTQAAEATIWSPPSTRHSGAASGTAGADAAVWESARGVAAALRRQVPLTRRLTWNLHPAPQPRRPHRKVPPAPELRPARGVTEDDLERYAPAGPAKREG